MVTDEDVTLVLAGAGTGKTSVIVGKVIHLVRNEGVAPTHILVLAFNTKAKEEIRGQLNDLRLDLTRVAVHTFHSYGYSIVAKHTKRKPRISELADDKTKLYNAIDDMLECILHDTDRHRIVLDFLLYYNLEYHSAFDFATEDEYKTYIRNLELRTLSGDRVKSFEELMIANYLTENGVAFDYEAEYEHDTDTAEYRQYHPDFFLGDHDIYIEHFALKEDDSSHFGLKYDEGVKWKRDIHARYGTKLIETHSWQRRVGTLLDELRKQLEEAGVELRPIPRAELVAKLKRQENSNLSKLLATFLDHVKTSSLCSEELRARADQAGDVLRNHKFLDLFEHIRDMYEDRLSEEETVDYHDLVGLAAQCLGKSVPSCYRYVLVDEFQDISAGRMTLLRAHNDSGVAFFLVGDDWQSINCFAGSDVGLMHNCGDHLGHVQRVHLSQTFRFSNNIGEPSTEFVQKNPAQSRRRLHSLRSTADEGIVVVAENDRLAGVKAALDDIASKSDHTRPELLVLGRYNHAINVLDEENLDSWICQNFRPAGDDRKGRMKRARDYFSTVHRAKGREADNVIVLDVNTGRWGFPSQINDDSLLDLVLPNESDKYPYSEERRLLYVALTRARYAVFLVTDSTRPSSFVEEILEGPNIRQIGAVAPKCPRCIGGHLVESKSAKNLRCTNQHGSPKCEYRAPRCMSCRRGYSVLAEGAVTCTSPDCDEPNDRCPKCRVGVMTRGKSQHGLWEYCSEKYSELPCHYKRNL